MHCTQILLQGWQHGNQHVTHRTWAHHDQQQRHASGLDGVAARGAVSVLVAVVMAWFGEGSRGQRRSKRAAMRIA
jgi:hypothetical protein